MMSDNKLRTYIIFTYFDISYCCTDQFFALRTEIADVSIIAGLRSMFAVKHDFSTPTFK